MKKYLVTGGLGFIGSHFIAKAINEGSAVVNLDSVTYAANFDNVSNISDSSNYHFEKGDICDQNLVAKILQEHKIDYVINFAAESHVDNSIDSSEIFIKTNINGTFSLLESTRKYYDSLSLQKKQEFRFLHVSTDEVFGSLEEGEEPFDESSRYCPNSPYSASKAASDHLVRSWCETYKIPTIITNCSNNFGPNQHQEKLIPTIIRNAISNKPIPIYGNGRNIRDWIYVKDHCDGIMLALQKGKISETYCLGGESELRNIEIAQKICEILDKIAPKEAPYKNQISFVEDRKGHDHRYAINNAKAKKELGFKIEGSFEDKLLETVNFYYNLIQK